MQEKKLHLPVLVATFFKSQLSDSLSLGALFYAMESSVAF